MRLLLDLNLPPALAATLRSAGLEAMHWSDVGSLRAPDRELLAWARLNGHVLVAHDLDFSAMLAASGEAMPSVVRVRGAGWSLPQLGSALAAAVRACEEEPGSGALLTLDPQRRRVRLLPLTPRE